MVKSWMHVTEIGPNRWSHLLNSSQLVQSHSSGMGTRQLIKCSFLHLLFRQFYMILWKPKCILHFASALGKWKCVCPRGTMCISPYIHFILVFRACAWGKLHRREPVGSSGNHGKDREGIVALSGISVLERQMDGCPGQWWLSTRAEGQLWSWSFALLGSLKDSWWDGR